MSLEDKDRKAIVQYRIERSVATLIEARGVAKEGWFNLSANRLYYAVYYAASSLLISRGIPANTHSGILSQMHLHFVKTGILSLQEGALLGQLFNLRQSGDYEDFKQVTKAQLDELTPLTEALIEKIKSLI